MEGRILDEGEFVGTYERRSYFSVVLREEADLGALNAELAGVVRVTMQLAHVSLWMRPLRLQKTAEVTLSNR
jgi:hypothetical protein